MDLFLFTSSGSGLYLFILSWKNLNGLKDMEQVIMRKYKGVQLRPNWTYGTLTDIQVSAMRWSGNREL